MSKVILQNFYPFPKFHGNFYGKMAPCRDCESWPPNELCRCARVFGHCALRGFGARRGVTSNTKIRSGKTGFSDSKEM